MKKIDWRYVLLTYALMIIAGAGIGYYGGDVWAGVWVSFCVTSFFVVLGLFSIL